MRTLGRMKRFCIAITILVLLSLLGCHAATPTEPALQSMPPEATTAMPQSTPPATTAPTEPAWPAAVPEDTQLFQLFQYNGSLKINWQNSDRTKNIWLSDPENNKFFVNSLDYDQFYDATFWIRLELTRAGRHYCDESWILALTARMSAGQGGKISKVTVVPYYENQMLAGWIVFGDIKSSVPAQLELSGEAGRQVQNIWLAPSVANTYIDQDLFAVTKITKALDITEVSDSLRSLQWEGNTYYFNAAEQGTPANTAIWFMVTPEQAFLQSETVLEVGVQEYIPVHGPGNPFSFNLTGSIRLYADPELTELAMIYVYIGEKYTDHVYLSLRWTDRNGVNQCTHVVTYTPGMLNP